MRPYDPDAYHDPFQLFENGAGELVPWTELAPVEQDFYHLLRAAPRPGLRLDDFLAFVGTGPYADRDEAWGSAVES
ncbi:MAG: hypothetical protein H0W72_03310 [Planctomycetes bacterium]|nr:hypothetical protein [Planctomycetota bacterium]